ncbi:MAG: dihydrofolate reductase family protein [Ferruginibacter sp.]
MAIKNRRLIVVNHLTLDGYFTDANCDSSWIYQNKNDAEWNRFVADNVSSVDVLLFGRVTYEMMAAYWSREDAMAGDPAMAGRMNNMQKLVFSKTLNTALWNNTKLLKGGLQREVRKMKKEGGNDIAILGSGSIVAQLAQEGLIDEFRVVVNPVLLGNGRTIFEGIRKKLSLQLIGSSTFANGNVLLCYAPAK